MPSTVATGPLLRVRLLYTFVALLKWCLCLTSVAVGVKGATLCTSLDVLTGAVANATCNGVTAPICYDEASRQASDAATAAVLCHLSYGNDSIASPEAAPVQASLPTGWTISCNSRVADISLCNATATSSCSSLMILRCSERCALNVTSNEPLSVACDGIVGTVCSTGLRASTMSDMCHQWYGADYKAELSVGSKRTGPVYSIDCGPSGALSSCSYTLANSTSCNHSLDAVVTCRSNCTATLDMQLVSISCRSSESSLMSVDSNNNARDLICRTFFGPPAFAAFGSGSGSPSVNTVTVICPQGASDLAPCTISQPISATSLLLTCTNFTCTFDAIVDQFVQVICFAGQTLRLGNLSSDAVTDMCQTNFGNGNVLGSVTGTLVGTPALTYQQVSGRVVIADSRQTSSNLVACDSCSIVRTANGAPLTFACGRNDDKYFVCTTYFTTNSATLACRTLYGNKSTGTFSATPRTVSKLAVELRCNGATSLERCTMTSKSSCPQVVELTCSEMCGLIVESTKPLTVTCNGTQGTVCSTGMSQATTEDMCHQWYGADYKAVLSAGSKRTGPVYSIDCGPSGALSSCSYTLANSTSCNHSIDTVVTCGNNCTATLAPTQVVTLDCDGELALMSTDTNDNARKFFCRLFFGPQAEFLSAVDGSTVNAVKVNCPEFALTMSECAVSKPAPRPSSILSCTKIFCTFDTIIDQLVQVSCPGGQVHYLGELTTATATRMCAMNASTGLIVGSLNDIAILTKAFSLLGVDSTERVVMVESRLVPATRVVCELCSPEHPVNGAPLLFSCGNNSDFSSFVCAKNFTESAAALACTELYGTGAGAAFTGIVRTGVISTTALNCNGSTSLSECSLNWTSCSVVVALSCRGMCTVNLTSNEPLTVTCNGTKGTVCSTGLSQATAEDMCHQWYGADNKAVLSVGSNATGPVYSIDCGPSGALSSCSYTLANSTSCNHSLDAVVTCLSSCTASLNSGLVTIACTSMTSFLGADTNDDAVKYFCRTFFGLSSTLLSRSADGSLTTVAVNCPQGAVDLSQCQVAPPVPATPVLHLTCGNINCTFDAVIDELVQVLCFGGQQQYLGGLTLLTATAICQLDLGTGLVLGSVIGTSIFMPAFTFRSLTGRVVNVDSREVMASRVSCELCTLDLVVKGAPLTFSCDNNTAHYFVCAEGFTSRAATLACWELYGEGTVGALIGTVATSADVFLNCSDSFTTLAECELWRRLCTSAPVISCVTNCSAKFISGSPLYVSCDVRHGTVCSRGFPASVGDSLCQSKYGNTSSATIFVGSSHTGVVLKPVCGPTFASCGFTRSRTCQHSDDVVLYCTNACSPIVAHGTLFRVSCDGASPRHVCYESSVVARNIEIATGLCKLFYGEEYVGRWYPSYDNVTNGYLMTCGHDHNDTVLGGCIFMNFSAAGASCTAAVTRCWAPHSLSRTQELTETVTMGQSMTSPETSTASSTLTVMTTGTAMLSHSTTNVCSMTESSTENLSSPTENMTDTTSLSFICDGVVARLVTSREHSSDNSIPTVVVQGRNTTAAEVTDIRFNISISGADAELLELVGNTSAAVVQPPATLFVVRILQVFGLPTANGTVLVTARVSIRLANDSVPSAYETMQLPLSIRYLQRRCVTVAYIPLGVTLLATLHAAQQGVGLLKALRAAGSVVGAVTAAPLSLGGTIGIAGTYGGLLVADLAACDFDPNETLTAWNSPTQLSIREQQEGSSQRGAAAAGVGLSLVVSGCAACVTFAAALLRSKQQKTKSILERMGKQMDYFGFPAILNAPFSLLLPSMLGPSVTCLMYRWSYLDPVIGGGAGTVAVAVAAATILPATFCFDKSAAAILSKVHRRRPALGIGWLSWKCFECDTEWDELIGETSFYCRYGFLFEHLRFERVWFVAVEVSLVVVSVALGGVKSSNRFICNVATGTLAAAYTLFGGAVFYFRPYNCSLNHWITQGNTAVSLLSLVLALTSMSEVAVVIGIVQTCCGVLSMLLLVVKALARRRLRRLFARRNALEELTNDKDAVETSQNILLEGIDYHLGRRRRRARGEHHAAVDDDELNGSLLTQVESLLAASESVALGGKEGAHRSLEALAFKMKLRGLKPGYSAAHNLKVVVELICTRQALVNGAINNNDVTI